ncbi:FAD-binding domain-containing protein [Sarocladium strictum]
MFGPMPFRTVPVSHRLALALVRTRTAQLPQVFLVVRTFSSTQTNKNAEEETTQISRTKRDDNGRNRGSGRSFALGVVFAVAVYGAGSSIGKGRDSEEPLLASTLPIAQSRTPTLNTDANTITQVYKELVSILGEEHVSSGKFELESHAGSDFSSYSNSDGALHFAIVYPSSTDDVSRIMTVCHAHRIPVTAYSGGTSLEGHFAPTQGGICVDFSRMDRIVKLHKDDLDVIVQPGVGWEDLNEQLATDDLFFPPDPGPGAKIGGMIGTGCSGTNAYRYGTMRDWVVSLTVVLADGTVITTRQRPRKSSAGYDLTRLFIGSEGTLGLVTEATLKLTARPQNTSVAIATFPSLYDAAGCVSRLVSSSVQVSGMELLDDSAMRFVNNSGATGRKWAELPSMFFRFSGSDSMVRDQIAIVKAAAESSSSQSFDFATGEEEAAELWSARKEALWSVMAAKKSPSDHVWTTDHGLDGGIVGHVGDGNYHAMILFSEAERPVAQRVVSDMVHRAIEMEGTVTGEHGIGLIKRDYLPREIGQPAVDTMRMIKHALDPQCILNRDKVFRTGQN